MLSSTQLKLKEQIAKTSYEGKKTLPEGSYGVEIGDFDFRTGQIVWSSGLWTFYTDESTAREISNMWRQEGIERVAQTTPTIQNVNGAYTTPERLAPFYRPIKLGR